MPRSSPTDFFTPDITDSVTSGNVIDQAKSANPLPAGDSQELYAVVFDAGSTGSRVHVVHFKESQGVLELQNDALQHLKPGLSSHADDPEKAAQSLAPLLDFALKTVPEELQVCSTIAANGHKLSKTAPFGTSCCTLSAGVTGNMAAQMSSMCPVNLAATIALECMLGDIATAPVMYQCHTFCQQS